MPDSVAILVPAMRPQNLERLAKSVADTTDDYALVIIGTGAVADAAMDLPNVYLIDDDGGTYPQRINLGFRMTDAPYLFLGADDVLFHAGWFDEAMKVMAPVDGVVGVNDMYNPAGVHFLVSRFYIASLGGCVDQRDVILHEGYRHCYCDDELRWTAKSRDRWAYAVDAVVEHLHPGAGKAPNDDVYALGSASMAQDCSLFASRSHLWST